MYIVSKYAQTLFEIKCATDIEDNFCHEMEFSLCDEESFFTQVNRLTLNVFTWEYLRTIERLDNKFNKQYPILVSHNILNYIPEDEYDLRENEYNIKIEREELETLILELERNLRKLAR
ncbi:hypothetical protein LKL95_23960 [Bacillus cereus]|uniref:hypothetical protein n=1 Tax=Bacillus cereus TaxID=1396 RepID=UPI0007ABF15F|nr:hypothetical protein [Bacillus cereus]KZD35843.1 hypothetical protein B4081_1495 [Bacillus cereus]MCC2396839.1 hypothetical protein [Bacillus cereus]MCU5660018.1 hypothetical protein [Bacillus cereus]MCU5720858.1 hypothetical protein [Bacillus cereus]